MRIPIAIAVVVALVGRSAIARGDSVSYDLWIRNTPPAVVEAGERAGLWADHRLSGPPTPYLRGDLDGDGRADHIVLVTARSDGKQSLVVLWGKPKRKPAWLAVSSPPSGDDGFWYVQPRRWKAPKAKGEVIVMTDPDPQVVYWTGKKLVAYPIAIEDPVDAGEPVLWAE